MLNRFTDLYPLSIPGPFPGNLAVKNEIRRAVKDNIISPVQLSKSTLGPIVGSTHHIPTATCMTRRSKLPQRPRSTYPDALMELGIHYLLEEGVYGSLNCAAWGPLK